MDKVTTKVESITIAHKRTEKPVTFETLVVRVNGKYAGYLHEWDCYYFSDVVGHCVLATFSGREHMIQAIVDNYHKSDN